MGINYIAHNAAEVNLNLYQEPHAFSIKRISLLVSSRRLSFIICYKLISVTFELWIFHTPKRIAATITSEIFFLRPVLLEKKCFMMHSIVLKFLTQLFSKCCFLKKNRILVNVRPQFLPENLAVSLALLCIIKYDIASISSDFIYNENKILVQ